MAALIAAAVAGFVCPHPEPRRPPHLDVLWEFG
jgi:hypothetical protein